MSKPDLTTPTCLWCEKRLQPNYKTVFDKDPEKQWYKQDKYKIRIIGYGYMNSNLFCSSTCGFNYAVETIKNDGESDVYLKQLQLIEESNEARGFLESGNLPYQDLIQVGKSMKSWEALRDQAPEEFAAIKEHIISDLIDNSQED